eukprot:jgi/Galph1/3196/GphlegSOOS_G1843.1
MTDRCLDSWSWDEQVDDFLKVYIELLDKYKKRTVDLLEQGHQTASEFLQEMQHSEIWQMLEETMENRQDMQLADSQEFSECLRQTILEQIAVKGLPKRRRENLSKDKIEPLRKWFETHENYPYPTEEEKKELSQVTGISVHQITNWFINRRKRVWKPQQEGRWQEEPKKN